MRCPAAAAFISLLLSLLAVAPLPAQASDVPPTEWSIAEVRRHLAGDDPAEVAWAAHVAGEKAMVDAIASLRDVLPRLLGEGRVSERARWHVLDALLRLGAEPTADELLPHATGSLRVPALLLAAKQPRANRRYFEVRMQALDGDEDLEWRVCGNQLAALRDPGLALRCVRQLQFELRLRVVDGRHPGYGWGCFGGAPPEPLPALPGFPPACYHALDPDNARSRTMPGLAAIAWRRLPLPPCGAPELPVCDPVRAHADWLMAVGGPATAIVCEQTVVEVEHRWRGIARLRSDVQTWQLQHRRAFAAMLRELVAGAELTAEQAQGCGHHVGLQLLDQRGDRARRLPPAAELLLPPPQ